MNYLLATTALVAAFAMGPALAQDDATPAPIDTQNTLPPTISPPEGYVEADMVLTSDNLEGAAVYDANDTNIGTVHGVVFANGSAALDDSFDDLSHDSAAQNANDLGVNVEDVTGQGHADQNATDQNTADQDMGDQNGVDQNAAGQGAVDQGVTDQDLTTQGGSDAGLADQNATEPGGAGLDTDIDNSMPADDGMAPDTAGDQPDITATDDTATPSMNDGTTDGDGMSDMADTGIDGTDTTTADAIPDAPARDDSGTMDATRVTHAIIDVGGFLGIGVHQVAVPLEDLRIYANENQDIRVYLPWTREQLEAMPEFDETMLAPVTD